MSQVGLYLQQRVYRGCTTVSACYSEIQHGRMISQLNDKYKVTQILVRQNTVGLLICSVMADGNVVGCDRPL